MGCRVELLVCLPMATADRCCLGVGVVGDEGDAGGGRPRAGGAAGGSADLIDAVGAAIDDPEMAIVRRISRLPALV